uniref:NSL1 component of MIS12 kinetochore complex n=1 Tax=Sinocyclocheilus rhinocerous TaxID=307959 RepID=A0A673LM57_9TELE
MEEDRESGADCRVNVKSKKHVREQLENYKDLFKKLLDGQCHISEEDKTKLLQEMVVNFEFTVQENLVIGGLSWDEASEDYCEDYESTINDILDEKIVETACKRNSYPKQIRNKVVRSLRAERKLLGLYEQAVKPQDLKPDPAQEFVIRNVSAAAPAVFKQASTVMKVQMYYNYHACVCVHTQYCAKVLDLHHRIPSTIKRAVSDSEYSADYVPAPEIIQKTDVN